ncbi:MAG TPA: PQQ-dependent sugar dehydrogenase [Nocardioidaceae bacterium]|nr:PQQ-dependent sugar dehydrogenase [Nocardioidaceae bacterium]
MDRRTLLKAGLVTTAGGLVIPAVDGLDDSAEAAPRVAKVLARNLATPWGIAFLPNGDALVGERDSGRVHRVRKGGGRRRVGQLQVRSEKANWGEGGLLGLALSPTFRRDRWVYAYISTGSDNRIVRMRFADGSLGRPRVVLAGIPTNTHHNGGRLVFHRGLLYASTGDAENGSLAQNRGSLAGKILRLTPDGRVPQGNPFGNYTWSYGHRNIEGIAFDDRGNLWASEFGDDRRDELNRIVRGGNYGWPHVEGGDGRGGYRDPLTTWSPENCSPSGIAIAGGRAFIGGLRGHALWAVRLHGPGAGRRVRYFHERFGRIRTVQKAPDGRLWITTSNHDGRPSTPHPNDDRIIRLAL